VNPIRLGKAALVEELLMIDKFFCKVMSRRRFLQVSASDVVTMTASGGTTLSSTLACTLREYFHLDNSVRLPRIRDDYANWVAKELGKLGVVTRTFRL
jgi:hypothetical protein